MPFRSSDSGGCQITSSVVEERVVTLKSVGGPDGAASNDRVRRGKIGKTDQVISLKIITHVM